ncbi:MAG: ABC transporter permease [Actinomycetota bacterium]|jgi:peptide/nickel transport system permease protein|nr:MAG: peptide/nickel transport system permease protein [Acidimicrobiaceae bacterium]
MRYVLRRFAQLIFVLVVVTFLTSIALRFLPGGTDVLVALKTGPGATKEQAQAVVKELGLDKPILTQYVNWMKDFVTGDWGLTFQTNQLISQEIKRGMPISLYLMIYAQLVALGIAIPVAVWSAHKQNSRFDRLGTTAAFGMLSTPNFIVAPVLILLFSVQNKWFPFPSIYRGLWDAPAEHFKAFALPTLTIAIPLFAGYMRLLRSDMIGTLQSDFITTARAKGVSTQRLLFGHALRPSLFSLVTSAAVNIGALMGGVVIVEQFFLLNGMGRLTVESIFRREYPTVQYCVVILAMIYVLVNFVVDIAYAFIDPRVRAGRALG